MTENFSKKLDSFDIKILRLLQRDCKMGIAKISKKVGKGISAVHTRIKAMEKMGVIVRYSAILNPALMERPTLAFILVTVRYRVPGKEEVLSQREFCRTIAKHPKVMGVHVLSGQFDVLLKVRTKDVDEMNKFIVDFLRPIPAVDRTLTMFTMDTYLDSLELRNLT